MEVGEEGESDWEEINEGTPSAPSTAPSGLAPKPGAPVGEWFVERAKFIPLRLTLSERKYLRLLEAALQVSEYTDKIDTIGFGLSKPKRIVHQIRELCAILSGLVLAADYKQVCRILVLSVHGILTSERAKNYLQIEISNPIQNSTSKFLS